jgi:hypothetical protein
MLTKKLILAGLAGATLAGTAPAFADGWHRRDQVRRVPAPRHVVVQQRHYAPPPRVVYYYPRPALVYHRPAPVYYAQPAYGASVSGDEALGVLLGAALGAFIGHEIATGR